MLLSASLLAWNKDRLDNRPFQNFEQDMTALKFPVWCSFNTGLEEWLGEGKNNWDYILSFFLWRGNGKSWELVSLWYFRVQKPHCYWCMTASWASWQDQREKSQDRQACRNTKHDLSPGQIPEMKLHRPIKIRLVRGTSEWHSQISGTRGSKSSPDTLPSQVL